MSRLSLRVTHCEIGQIRTEVLLHFSSDHMYRTEFVEVGQEVLLKTCEDAMLRPSFDAVHLDL